MEKILSNDRICSRHFQSGKPADLIDAKYVIEETSDTSLRTLTTSGGINVNVGINTSHQYISSVSYIHSTQSVWFYRSDYSNCFEIILDSYPGFTEASV